MDFLWKKVSEKEKEDIRKQSENIMKNFSKKLESVKGNVKDSSVGTGDFERDEGAAEPPLLDKKIMFDNAPNKNKDSIIAEKKSW